MVCPGDFSWLSPSSQETSSPEGTKTIKTSEALKGPGTLPAAAPLGLDLWPRVAHPGAISPKPITVYSYLFSALGHFTNKLWVHINILFMT